MPCKNTIFSDLLKLVSRQHFDKCVSRYKGDKHTKGFSCWNQFVSMLYCQLTGKRSLREIEAGFNQHRHTHYHLHTMPLKRSTLSDANNKRDARIYQDLLKSLMTGVGNQLRSKTSRAIEILDSTQIKLNESLFHWAAKGHRLYGIKAHISYSLSSGTPSHFSMSNVNLNDVELFKELPIQKGTLYLFDRGYYDFRAWCNITDKQASFITRAKKNLAYNILKENPIKDGSILSDQVIELSSSKSKPAKGYIFRLIHAIDHEGREIRFITNDINLPAVKIKEYYRQRWQIEIFFKWIKQNLKVKRYIGRSENAVRTQLVIAIIAYILLKLWHYCTHPLENLQYLASTIQDSLMRRPTKPQYPPGLRPKNNPNIQLDLAL